MVGKVLKIGILALQGAIREHRKIIQILGHETVDVLSSRDLVKINGLIIPGGESTTVGKLLVRYDLLNPIIKLGQNGMPIFGTCTGLILLSKHIDGGKQHCLGLMDTYVRRNAFGRQVDSFDMKIPIPILGTVPYHTIFIRAPYIYKVDKRVTTLLNYKNKIVFAEQNNFLVTAFHPELTNDMRIHKYFIQKILNC